MNLLILPLNVVASILFSDLLSGFAHWLEDTYGTTRGPAFLKRWIVLDNIRHHRLPGVILRQSWWECNRVPIAVGSLLGAACWALRLTDWRVYLIVALASQSNQIHRWAHQRTPPRLVRGLQRIGVFQSRAHHAEHHRRPCEKRYCTSTNWVNPILDTFHFWRGPEALLRFVFGVHVQRTSATREGY